MITRDLSVIARVIGAIFFGFLGMRTGSALAEGDEGLTRVLFWTLSPIGFTIFGALATPTLLLPPLGRIQKWSREIQPAQLILGTTGLLAGLLVGALLSPALLTLPGIGSLIAPFIVSFILGVLGVAIMVGREDDLSALIGRYTHDVGQTATAPNEIVIDTSAIIDGRIADIAATGFLQGNLVIPRFVLDELRYIADSPDSLRRSRGRRGLELLGQMRKDEPLPLRIAEDDFPEAPDVDAKLIRLCQRLNGPLLTNDFNLNRIAELENIQVLNVNGLSNAVKAIILPGEEMAVQIIQEGREEDQGVGYLNDGTMVVVEGGRHHLNKQLDVIVTRVLQTVAGRMIFAQPKGA